jgi:pyruvate formate-lyase activating enzyme-like uncharacterized protein
MALDGDHLCASGAVMAVYSRCNLECDYCYVSADTPTSAFLWFVASLETNSQSSL